MAWKNFAMLPVEAIMDERIRGNKLLVLCAILSFANKSGLATGWTRAQMAERCGLPITRFSTVTSELEATGWLKKIGKGGRDYQVVIPEIVTESVTIGEAQTVTESVIVSSAEKVTDSVTPTVTESVTVTDSVTVTESVTNSVTDSVTPPIYSETTHTIKPIKQRKSRVDEEVLSLPEWIKNDAWEMWIDHRKKIRKPLSLTAQKLNLKQLTKFRDGGHDPNDIIETSIASGWQGLFEPKAKPTQLNQPAKSSGYQRQQTADEIIAELERRDAERAKEVNAIPGECYVIN